MADIRLMPLHGMNTAAEDAALQIGGDDPKLFVRDALNVDITPAGKTEIRPGARQMTDAAYRNLWQSPLHKDLFGTLGEDWVKIDPASWTHEVLATVGEGSVSHEVLNNLVSVATPSGIYTYDGQKAQRLTLDTPAAPLVVVGDGSLEQGAYGVAVAWLRGSMESALSEVTTAHVGAQGALEITPPLCLDPTVTGIRLYLTRQDGGELLRAGDHPLAMPIIIPLLPRLGAPAQFRHLSPMPTGKWLRYWRGRIVTATANVLRFSEAMAYHLHDERHGFVQMPQRITFVQPVESGIWVGQVDHVAFLQGASPQELSVSRKASRAPVPGSAMLVPAEVVGGNLAGGGAMVAVWLAENGYVAGTSEGALSEIHAGVMSNIAADSGTSVVLDRRLITAVT